MMSPTFTPRHARPAVVLAVLSTVCAGLMLSACSTPDSPPQQVESKNPSVTYKYRGDKELLQANQNAETFCSQYHSIARTADISSTSDGTKTVVFDCVASTTATVPVTQPLGSNMAYSYQTDQQLLEASRNADAYCATNGSQRALTNTTVNIDGTKTLTFQCVPE
jgi:hypothetical protein